MPHNKQQIKKSELQEMINTFDFFFHVLLEEDIMDDVNLRKDYLRSLNGLKKMEIQLFKEQEDD